MAGPDPHAELLSAWSDSVLEVHHDGDLAHPSAVAASHGEVVHLITAWNPDALEQPAAANQAADDLLVEVLESMGQLRHQAVGRSRDGTWREEGWCVVGLTRDEARALGARFGQVAVYEATPETVHVVWCSEDRLVDVTATVSGPLEG